MAAAYVKSLLTGYNTSGAVFGPVVLSGSKTVTLDNTIYLVISTQTGTPSFFPSSWTDNLGNTYTKQYSYRVNGLNNSEHELWSAPVTNAGTLTTQTGTITYPSVIPNWAAGSCEFSDAPLTMPFLNGNAYGSNTEIVTFGQKRLNLILLCCGNFFSGSGSRAVTWPMEFTGILAVAPTSASVQGVFLAYRVGPDDGFLEVNFATASEATIAISGTAAYVAPGNYQQVTLSLNKTGYRL